MAAASAVCSAYEYTGPDNCNPAQHLSGDTVTVASGASTYNPAYYAVVGLLAQPFSGAGTDFAIRAFTALMAALLLAWAAVVTSRLGAQRVAHACAARLGDARAHLQHDDREPQRCGVRRRLPAVGRRNRSRGATGASESGSADTAAVTMMATHSTGVMWLALVVAVIALAPAAEPVACALPSLVDARSPRRSVHRCWAVRRALPGSCSRRPTSAPSVPRDAGSDRLQRWVSSPVARSPGRCRPSAPSPCATIQRPGIVYALWLVPFVFLMVAGIRSASSRLRLAASGPARPLGGGSPDVDRHVLRLAGSGLARALRAATGGGLHRSGGPGAQQGYARTAQDPVRRRSHDVCAGADDLLPGGRVGP